MEKKGIIFDIKHFAIHDGPGIRTTVFFKGCPLECWWCHNPEGLTAGKEIFYYETKCMECYNCINVCPTKAISKDDEGVKIERKKCNICGECVKKCPTGSLHIVGRYLNVSDVMEEIEKSVIYFNKSGGGVTFSGGEPLMQPDFLIALIKACKERGINIALDTSGYASKEVFNNAVDDIDIFLYDLKFIKDSLHKKYTGVSNKVILDNIRTLIEKGRGNDIFIRFTVIPDITDREEDLNEITEFLSSLKYIRKVNLLPFHNVVEKYKRIGRESKMNNRKTMDMARIKYIKEHFQRMDFSVKVGG